MNSEINQEIVLLAGADIDGNEDAFERSMTELANLAKACNMNPVGRVCQKMDYINKGLYLGTGKVQEVKETAALLDVDLIIFNDTLTPSQLRNLQNQLEKPVMDRTTLILDIFDTRAKTREAKLQVETARLQYLLPRLVGMHQALTRQGGTSGSMSSRGAGEKKLELDRRRIEHRLSELRKELELVTKERLVQRQKRINARIPLVALVGYTNAGKSTIMNALVDNYVQDKEKRVLEKDMLFATLDTTVRRINTGNNQDFLLSDTVGFIHKLPTGLVKAFRSTLEEVQNADLLLHVIDLSDSDYQEQIKTTTETLRELGAGHIPTILVFNKADKCTAKISFPQRNQFDKITISAKQNESIDMLVNVILERVYKGYVNATFMIPFEKGELVSYFRQNAQILNQDYTDKGTKLQVCCHKADLDKYKVYLWEDKALGEGTTQ